MKIVKNNYFDIVFYKEYNHEGAFPDMIRKTFKIRKHSEKVFQSIKKTDNCVLMGTSSFFTFFSCLFLKLKGNNITIAPLGQLHPFLDNDNPFEFGDEFVKEGWDLKNNNSRRLNGKKSFKTTLRSLYRLVWKRFFVRLMLFAADNVLVLSNYEAQEVKKLNSKVECIRLLKWFYNPYDRDGVILDLPKNKINLLYWGRVDIYYKGIDVLIKSIPKLLNTNLYISGGDYRGGKDKLKSIILDNKIDNIIIEESIISYKNLKDFDYMILPSRWEGYFRAPHDAKENNLKVIYRDSTNFDFFSSDEDFEFSTDEELEVLLKKIDSSKNV